MNDVTNPAEPEVTADDAEDFEAFENSVEEHETEDELTDLDEEDSEEVAAPASADDEFDEIEWKGGKYKVPKGAALMQADYTRKTQEIAELRKAAEAEREQSRQISNAEINAAARIVSIDEAIKEYGEIDFDEWDETNPQESQKAWRAFQRLKEQRQGAVATLGQARQQRTLQEQRATAERVQQGQAVLKEQIPGWNGDKAKALLDFGQKNYGFSEAELHAKRDARDLVVLHDAMQYRQLLAKTKQRAKVDAVQAVKPAATLRGNSGGGIRPSTTDFAAFERMANKAR